MKSSGALLAMPLVYEKTNPSGPHVRSLFLANSQKLQSPERRRDAMFMHCVLGNFRMLRVWCLVGLLLTFIVPAKAATTVFASSVYSSTGTVTNAANSFGASDGSNATVARNAVLTLNIGKGVAGTNFLVTGVRTGTAGTNIRVSLGAIVGGVATFSATQNFTLASGTSSFNFSAACAGFGVQGCTLMRVQVTGPVSSSFALDGISGISATPEPSAWALMILAFIGVAWRLKSVRSNSRQMLAFA
jgi:hypothetical protein